MRKRCAWCLVEAKVKPQLEAFWPARDVIKPARFAGMTAAEMKANPALRRELNTIRNRAKKRRQLARNGE